MAGAKGIKGIYKVSFSAELKDYYRRYHLAHSTADMASLTWIGKPKSSGSQEYLYSRLDAKHAFRFDPKVNQYVLSRNMEKARLYFFVPWKWSDKALNPVPQDSKYDKLDIFLSGSSQQANGGSTGLPGWQPAVNNLGNAFPSPFAFVETNSGPGKKNNGDISLINGYSLPLSIEQESPDSKNPGPSKVSSGVSYANQETLHKTLSAIAPYGRSLAKAAGQSNGIRNPWSFVDPEDSSGKVYSDLRSYLLSLAANGESSWLYNYSPGGGLSATASFYSDGSNPYIIIQGTSTNNASGNKLEKGLWFLPWDKHQLGKISLLKSKFGAGEGANRGLASTETIYGNAGKALFLPGGKIGHGHLSNPEDLNSVLTYFNNSNTVSSYTGHSQYGGDLFLGLVYGFIGSSERLASTNGLPTNAPTPPSGSGFGTTASTAIGKLPSYWWYANGSSFSKTNKTGSFLGPLAKGQIGGDLWKHLKKNEGPNWNTYAVNIRKNNPSLYTYDSSNGGGLTGPYVWPMDDRLGGNLVYFDTKGNWLNIDLGAPYTGKNLTLGTGEGSGGEQEQFEQVGFRSDESGRWSPPGTRLGSTYLTMFVSSSAKVTAIGGQDISLTNAEGAAIESSRFDSSNRTGGGLHQGLGTSLYEATSDAAFHAIAAKTEGRSIGANNLQLIEVPDQQFAVQAGSAASTQEATSVTDENGVWVTSFADQTSVAFSTGVFDLFGHTSPQTIKLLATSVGRNTNTLIAYRVDSITGEVGGFYWTALVPDIVNSGREEQGSISV